MSLMRALTTRRHKVEEIQPTGFLGRAASVQRSRAVRRSQISSPVALVSTTNPLSYEAPDIVGTKPIQRHQPSSSQSSADVSPSADESDSSTLDMTSNTDASSIDNLPISPEPEPIPNHLSCYFKPNVLTDNLVESPPSSPDLCTDAPQIPHRVPSHSKKAHERVHRKHSLRRMMSPPTSLMRANSEDSFFEPVEALKENPFSNELAQLDEAAEEIGHAVRDVEAKTDVAVMAALGLGRFSAADYLGEIHALLYDEYLVDNPVWI